MAEFLEKIGIFSFFLAICGRLWYDVQARVCRYALMWEVADRQTLGASGNFHGVCPIYKPGEEGKTCAQAVLLPQGRRSGFAAFSRSGFIGVPDGTPGTV